MAFRKYNLEADALQEISKQEFLALSCLLTTRLDSEFQGFEKIQELIFDKVFKSRQTKRGIYKEAQKRRTIRLLLCNYYHCFCNSVPLAIPLNSNFYTNLKHSYQDIVAIKTFLEDEGWSQGIEGSHFLERASVNWAAGLLEEEFNQFQTDPRCILEYQPTKELVEVKDKEKNLIKLKNNRTVIQSEKLLGKYNEFIGRQKIGISGLIEWSDGFDSHTELLNHLYKILFRTINNNEIFSNSFHLLGTNQSNINTLSLHYNRIWEHLCRKNSKADKLASLNSVFHTLDLMRFPTSHHLTRVFNNRTVKEGGRLYGSPIQRLSKNLRKTVTFNGQSTIELDFSCYHTSILYHKHGIDLPPEPYIYPKGLPLRDIMKLILNTAFNIQAENGSVRATTIKTVLEELNFKKPELKEALRISPYYENSSGNAYRALQAMYDELYEYHEPVQRAFGSNEGMRLQRIDSDIAAKILTCFTEREIPIIPIHDSFIVPSEHESYLRLTMKQIYFEKFNKPIEVK